MVERSELYYGVEGNLWSNQKIEEINPNFFNDKINCSSKKRVEKSIMKSSISTPCRHVVFGKTKTHDVLSKHLFTKLSNL